jgi:hypothetical protein
MAFVVCLKKGTAKTSLDIGRVYRVIRAARNDPPASIRVIDESGEDYLYPQDWFEPVELPDRAARALKRHERARR